MRSTLLGLVIATGALCGAIAGADAADRRPQPLAPTESGAEHPKSSYYRRAPQVRGFVQRRGGYSYYTSDSINTYGNSRSLYGSLNSYRDPFADRQSRSGPFDHGFFFDSGVAPRGGDSPYRN